MKVTVTTLSELTITLDVSEDLELENFKALCEMEFSIPIAEMIIVLNGTPLLNDKKSLKEHGIVDGDVIILQHMQSSNSSFPSTHLDSNAPEAPSSSRGSRPRRSILRVANDDPVAIRDMFLRNPDKLALMQQNNPALAEALLSENLDTFKKELLRQWMEPERTNRANSAHPFDTDAQRMIAEEIRQQNIDANMEAAIQHMPETFGQVCMLYIKCKVNNHPVIAFIDSGAQATIMSVRTAERCNIMRLVDTRFAGIAHGVGVQKIIGRIHLVQIQIEDTFLITSFSILEEQPMDMLLGLDMLKRHLCNIDLKQNLLRIGTTDTETPFLRENEVSVYPSMF